MIEAESFAKAHEKTENESKKYAEENYLTEHFEQSGYAQVRESLIYGYNMVGVF